MSLCVESPLIPFSVTVEVVVIVGAREIDILEGDSLRG